MKKRNRKKKEESLNSTPIQFRATQKEHAFLLERAKVCTQGNLAAYARGIVLGLLPEAIICEEKKAWDEFRKTAVS